ncbi:hypothetical protein BD769DRAFT_1371641 [Suillus cothurnatus]|nr:hypothetical protein BD769DRAFT_1371641 [Suillus cothurnatus]
MCLSQRFKNQTLRNRDELLYIDLCQAMNTGDIGRVEASFLPWIYIFKATSKHKYLSQISRFLNNLQFNWLESLSDIIRMNLLCNPTRKSVAFCAVDWLVEHNNLYTKESLLIEIYRSCHVTMENAFHLQHQTIWHSALDMTKTIKTLLGRMSNKNVHLSKDGWKALQVVPDRVSAGMTLMQEQKVINEEDNSGFDIEVVWVTQQCE